ncbi:MAG: signal peptidase I [bacterium]
MKLQLKEKINAFRNYLNLVLYVLALFLFTIIVIRFFVISPGKTNGPSMQPTFVDNDLFFVNKIVYLFTEPKRYDIVQIIDPEDQKLMLKRIIGMPGEVIIIKRGKVFVRVIGETQERQIIESDYLDSRVYTKLMGQNRPLTYVVGDGQYFLLGDNRPKSTDSRYYGPVLRTNITGRIIEIK